MLSVLTCLHEGTMSDDYVKVFEEGNQACIKLAYSAIKMVLYSRYVVRTTLSDMLRVSGRPFSS